MFLCNVVLIENFKWEIKINVSLIFFLRSALDPKLIVKLLSASHALAYFSCPTLLHNWGKYNC